MLGLLGSILIPALRQWRRSQDQAQAQQAAMLVVQRLREDFRMAHPESVAADATGVCFVTCQAEDGRIYYGEDGSLLWQRRLRLYREPDSDEVRLAFCDLPDDNPTVAPGTGNPDPLRREDLEAVTQERVLARDVTDFSVSLETDGLLRVRVKGEVDQQKSELETTLGTLKRPAPGEPAT